MGAHWEAILDYSLYDAHEAGFETAVIIIKEAIREDFMETVGRRLEKCPMEIRYAYQEMDKMLPQGYPIPSERKKPWGTSHCVLCAREKIGDAPFAVINSDDYYGKDAFRVIYDFLSKAQDGEKYHYAMVGYQLGKTVTDHGSVARGQCEVDGNGLLTGIHERTRIEKYPGGIHYTEDGGESWVDVPEDTTVSMNFWGFTGSFIPEIAARFPNFLKNVVPGNPVKAEYYLPVTVEELLSEGKAQVEVLHSADHWFGVTYAADKPAVVAALAEKTARGEYPRNGLWEK